MKSQRKGYSLPFKQAVAETYRTTGMSAPEVGKRFGCHKSQVYYWDKQASKGMLNQNFAVAFSRRPSENKGSNAAIKGITA
jgi:transposase